VGADALRDALRAYLVEHLGDPEAVLVIARQATQELWASRTTAED
jgi:hypothetical protein